MATPHDYWSAEEAEYFDWLFAFSARLVKEQDTLANAPFEAAAAPIRTAINRVLGAISTERNILLSRARSRMPEEHGGR